MNGIRVQHKQKQILPLALACAGIVVFSGGLPAVLQAQDGAQAQTQQSGQRTDGQIEMDVVKALDGSDALKNDMITAATIQGEVSLSGTVSSDASKRLAESICSHVAGVTKVTNNLKVGNPQDAQNDAQDNAQQGQPTDSYPDENAQVAPQDNQPAYQNQQPSYPNQQNQYPDQGQNQAQNQAPPPPQYGDQSQQPYPPTRQPYGQPYPPQYQQQYPPQAPRYEQARGPVTIPPGTMLSLRTSESLDNKRAKEGTPVQFTVIRDVAVGGVLAIPKGATVHGVVTESKKAGDLGGSAELALRLTSLDLGGRSYDLDTDLFRVKGPNKSGETVGNAIGGGIIGTIIGCAVGRGAGCAVGAGAGVAAGVGASAASSGPRAWIPAEALVTFHVNTPLTVDPVSPQEAARLAQGLYPGGPSLYRRGPYPPAYYGGPYPYTYGPVYYRPYYTVGGVYYWR